MDNYLKKSVSNHRIGYGAFTNESLQVGVYFHTMLVITSNRRVSILQVEGQRLEVIDHACKIES